jgi:glycosyltransferase involved in cell wall biosynthesis
LKKLLYIGNKLSEHGVNQTTIETLGPLLEKEGYKLIYASSKKNQFLRILDMLWTIWSNCDSDYVIIDTYSTSSFWYTFATSQLCRTLNLKYIPFLHGGNLPKRLGRNPMICNMIFNHSYTCVAPSNYLLEAFRNHGYSNVVYIPNAIDIGHYLDKERKQASPKLLWVRSFAEIYNPMMAVRVLQQLQERHPEASLCMVGPDKDGSLNKTQKLADDLGVSVIFTGKLSKQEWATLAQEYDIFINTTHFDNMPVSVIEAMALGLAVVSTNVGGIPFLLEHQYEALLVGDNEVSEMVAAINQLIDCPSLFNQITTNANQKAITFDWKIVNQQWFKILQ